MKPTPRWVAELMRKVEVICGCWSELAIHAGYRTEKNEEQIVHVFQKELRRKTMSCPHSRLL